MIRRFREFWALDARERRDFAILCVVFALILSFDQWGADSFDVWSGLKNLVIALVIVAASLLAHDAGHRLFAKKYRYHSSFQLWIPGLVACAAIAVFTNGSMKLFLGGSVVFTHSVLARLSKTQYKESLREFAMIAFAGPMAGLLFAAAIQGLSKILPLNPGAVSRLVYFNIVYSVMCMIPIPPLDGSKILVFGRGLYVFTGSAIVIYALLGLLGYFSLILTLILSCAATVFYYLTFENNSGKVKI